jgi:alpha-galactosidase
MVDHTRTLRRDIEVAGLPLQVDVEVAGTATPVLDVRVEPVGSDGILLVHLDVTINDGAPFELHRLQLGTTAPAIDMHGCYLGGDPGFELGYLPHEPFRREVAAHRGVPLLVLMHRSGACRLAFGLLDQLVESTWDLHLSEVDRAYHLRVTRPARPEGDLPAQRSGALRVNHRWTETVYVNTTGTPWPDVLAHYAQLARAHLDVAELTVPDHAFEPVFCTWTAVHHEVDADWALETARLAAELGFRTWITDDGWHHEVGRFGRYDDVGAWQPAPSRFPDLAAHVRDVQELGLRYLLWVAPFMVGTASQLAEDAAECCLAGNAAASYDLLCPHHEKTARHVRELLQRLVRDYGLDGLKIDFIDALPTAIEEPDHQHSTSIGRAVFDLLRDTIAELAATEPGLLIEFRNRYANLASRAYANLYRASDLPINFLRNRWQTTMLRLLAPEAAVVTDPMLWHPDDSDENVAVHLINGIAAVPMVSVDLLRSPASHIELIRTWIGFYREHRRTLAHGRFRPVLRGTSIPRTDFIGDEEIIHGLYEDTPVTFDVQRPTHWVLNASGRDVVQIDCTPGQAATLVVRDRFGRTVDATTVRSIPARVPVEIGGSLELHRM